MTSDAIDTFGQPILAECGAFSEERGLKRTEKNGKALQYIHDRGGVNNTMWLRYTEYAGVSLTGDKLFRCIHQKKQKRGGSNTTEICGFGALRQTVRRHVEATHLGIA